VCLCMCDFSETYRKTDKITLRSNCLASLVHAPICNNIIEEGYEEQDAYLYTSQGKPLLSTALKVHLNLHKHGLFPPAALATDSYGMLLGQYYSTLISPDCQAKHSTALFGIIIHCSATRAGRVIKFKPMKTKHVLLCYHRHSPDGGHHLAQTSLWQSTAVRRAWRFHVAPHRTAPQCHLCEVRGANTYLKKYS